MTPTTQKALYLERKQGDYVIGDIPVPRPGAGEVLVKVMAAGLNPADWLFKVHGMFIQDYPFVLGIDYAGTIESLGEGVESFTVGDKVFTASAFQKGHHGFQQYALAVASTISKIPENISFEQASTIGCTLATAVVGLYQAAPGGLGLPMPTASTASTDSEYSGSPIVIVGGSTSVGQYAIQLAKISGFNPIITTASLSNTAYLVSLGATHVLDRGLAADALKTSINDITHAPIKYLFSCVATDLIQELAVSIADDGARVAIVSPHPTVTSTPRKEVVGVAAWLREPANIPLLEPFFQNCASEWFKKGIIKPNKIEVLPGGLQAVPAGAKRLENGEVSALKLVVRPQEM